MSPKVLVPLLVGVCLLGAGCGGSAPRPERGALSSDSLSSYLAEVEPIRLGVNRLLDGAEHDRDVRAQADRVRRAVGLQPLLGVDLVRAEDRTDRIVEDLGRGARQ